MSNNAAPSHFKKSHMFHIELVLLLALIALQRFTHECDMPPNAFLMNVVTLTNDNIHEQGIWGHFASMSERLQSYCRKKNTLNVEHV